MATYQVGYDGKLETFINPHDAGVVFYHADINKRPHVVRHDSKQSHTFATTELDNSPSDGPQRLVKRLPDKIEGAEQFNNGYLNELEKSVRNRLASVNWQQASPMNPPKLEATLSQDLKLLASHREPSATGIWKAHAPSWAIPPHWAQDSGGQKREQPLPTPALDRRNPPYGITQIDGKPATAVRFVRQAGEKQTSYHLTFTLDGQHIARLRNLDAAALEEALGAENARKIQQAESDKGTLKGEALHHVFGLSPETAERQHQLTPNMIVRESAMPDRPREIDELEALERVSRYRAVERQLRERRGGAPDQVVEGARKPQAQTAEQDAIQQELMKPVYQQFRAVGSRFYFKDGDQKLAFTDKGSYLTTPSNEQRVSQAMTMTAAAKGWQTIRVTGSAAFQRSVWLEGSLRGIEVRGYKPTQHDLEDLKLHRERGPNVVSQVHEAHKQQETSQQAATKSNQTPLEVDEKKAIVRAVFAKTVEQVKDPDNRKLLWQEFERQLEQRAQAGRIPTVYIYDQNAPSRIKPPQQEQKQEQKQEHQIVRTR